jgi:hypothetical protein
MGVLDYTNIIGKSFSTMVKDQLKARQKILSNNGDTATERTNSDLLWLTNRNGWLRVTSNVDIKAGADGGPLAKAYGAGSELAKKYVLQGGVVYSDPALNNGSVLRAGVGPDKAYGVGYKPGTTHDLGLKPMPGITSFSISCDGPYGALKTANIKIKAYDIEQFNIMETLYCHLGYSLLVEFGHIPYINNEGVLQTQIQTLPIFNLSSKEDIAFAISKMVKQSCGNYDALFGTVTNYSWTANPDGSYDIDLKVIGPGSIVESLTINYTTSKLGISSKLKIYQDFMANNIFKALTSGEVATKPEGYDDLPLEQKIEAVIADQQKDALPGIIASRNNSIIHQHLFRIFENALTSQQVQNRYIDKPWYENITTGILSTIGAVVTGGLISPTTGDEDTPASDAIASSTDAAVAGKIFGQNQTYDFLKVAGDAVGGNIFAQKGNNSWLINHPDDKKVPNISPSLFSYLVIAYLKSPKQETSSAESTNKDQLPNVYIPLGYFLAILQSSGMLYNSKKGDDKGKNTRPIIYLDFNDNTNFCYAREYSLSVDPSICLVNIASPSKLFQTLFGGLTVNKEEILPDTSATIKSDYMYSAAEDLLSAKIKSSKLEFYNTATSGKMMRILLNLEYLVNKIDSLAGEDEKKEVKIDKLLNDILVDVNNSMGGLNQFRVAFDDDSYCIRLMDEQRLNDGNGEPVPGVIDVLGLSSLVQNYSLTSKITPKLAAMLIIGAQASNNQSKAAATDASAVGKWNEYVKDRIIPSKVDSTAGEEGGPKVGNAKEKAVASELPEGEEGEEGEEQDDPDNQLAKHIKGVYCKFRYNAEDVEAVRNTLSEKLKAWKANEEETEAAQMIPLEFTIKMDGISGILVNQAFIIPPERLPISYQDKTNPSATKLGFIVRKVENTIEGNQWLTSISGQSLNLTNSFSVPTNTIVVDANPLSGLPASKLTTGGVANKQSLDPTAQKLDNEKTMAIKISGKNITPNTYTFLPKNAKKEVDVFIFYPGVIIADKVGRDYMPQKIKAGAADWFDKYVLVFPTTYTTSYSDVKKEYEALLSKAGLTQRTLNIGIYSGSGNEGVSVLSAVASAGKELRNFVMMDPVPSTSLQTAVKARQSIGGTFQWLYYNPAAWGGASYYGGENTSGLYGNIKNLAGLLTNSYKTKTAHYDIPASMISALKSQIEKSLG